MDDAVTVRETTNPSGIRLVDSPQRTDVTVYPDSLNGERGGYSPAALSLADELRGPAVVRPWHDVAYCDILSERGPVADAVLSVALGIASSAAWDALKALLRRKPSQEPVKLTVGWVTPQGEKWVFVEGPAHAVAETLNTIQP